MIAPKVDVGQGASTEQVQFVLNSRQIRQLRVLGWGPRGPGFKSRLADQLFQFRLRYRGRRPSDRHPPRDREGITQPTTTASASRTRPPPPRPEGAAGGGKAHRKRRSRTSDPTPPPPRRRVGGGLTGLVTAARRSPDRSLEASSPKRYWPGGRGRSCRQRRPSVSPAPSLGPSSVPGPARASIRRPRPQRPSAPPGSRTTALSVPLPLP